MKRELTLGSSGWLGKIGEEFSEQNLVRLGHAFAAYLDAQCSPSPPLIAVGFDGRKNSKESASLLAEVLATSGINALLSSAVVPTPVLSFAVKHNKCNAGIMITGGNLPSDYNGVEFKGIYGGPFTHAETARVGSFLSEAVKEPKGRGPSSIKGEVVISPLMPDYLSHLETIVDCSALRSFAEDPKNNPNLLIDSMGGAGQTIVEDFLVECGWRAQTLFGSHENNFFDRRPESIPSHLDALKYNVKVVDTQFGVAIDGDCTHCGIVFSDGTWMHEQDSFLALLWHLRTNKKWKGGILRSGSATGKIEKLAKSWNAPLIEAGSENWFDEFLSGKLLMGNLSPGGYVFGNHIPECDGILSSLLFAEMIAMSATPLHQIIEEIQ